MKLFIWANFYTTSIIYDNALQQATHSHLHLWMTSHVWLVVQKMGSTILAVWRLVYWLMLQIHSENKVDMGTRVRLFNLLLWKNFKLQQRKVFVTFLEIFLPTLFALILILIRQKVQAHDEKHGLNFTSFRVDDLPGSKFLRLLLIAVMLSKFVICLYFQIHVHIILVHVCLQIWFWL